MEPFTVAYAAVKTGRFWLKAAPWLLIAMLVLSFVVVWKIDASSIDGLIAERDSARHDLTIARADVNRWIVAAEAANTANDIHNAEVEKAWADLARAETLLTTAEEVAQKESADLNAEIAKWKERVNAHPDQTCILGPIDRDAVRVLVRP